MNWKVVQVDENGEIDLTGIGEPNTTYEMSVHADGSIVLVPLSAQEVAARAAAGQA